MTNPSNFSCPSDIARFVTTDYRPNKSLYVNVRNNNQFRQYLQNNAVPIMDLSKRNYYQNMHCGCEDRKNYFGIRPFNYEDNYKCQGMGKTSDWKCGTTDLRPYGQGFSKVYKDSGAFLKEYQTNMKYEAMSDRGGSYNYYPNQPIALAPK